MHTVTWNGKQMSLAALAREVGMPSGTLWNRIFVRKMSLEEAVLTPVDEIRRDARYGVRKGRRKKECRTYPDCFNCPYPDCWVSGMFPGESRHATEAASAPEPYVSAFEHVYPVVRDMK